MAYTKIGKIRPSSKGQWNSDAAYEVLDVVMATDGSKAYMAVRDVPAGTALDDGEYWKPVVDVSAAVEYAAGINIGEWLNQHPEATTTVQDGSLSRAKFVAGELVGISIADCVDGELTNANFGTALNNALAISSNVYIPAGTWAPVMEISDVSAHIVMDANCVITLAKNDDGSLPAHAIKFTNCDITLSGGRVEYIDPSNPDDFPTTGENYAIIEYVNCPRVTIRGVDTSRCDYTCVHQFEDCDFVTVDGCRFENLMFMGLHLLKHAKSYIVRNCYCKNVRIPNRSNIWYSYFSCAGMRSISDPDNINIMPPDYVSYENNYCEDCHDSALDSHGATVMRAINNTCINCHLSLTLYDDSNRVARPDGFRTELIEVVGNRIVSDYVNDDEVGNKVTANGATKHPGLMFATYGNSMEGTFVFRDNYYKNTKNTQEAGLYLNKIENATIENSYIECVTPYAVSCNKNNLVRISNCNIKPGTTGKKIRLESTYLVYDGIEKSNMIAWTATGFVGFDGIGCPVGERSPLIRAGQLTYGNNGNTMALAYTYYIGITLHPQVSRAAVDGISVSGSNVIGLALPRGTRVTLTSGTKVYTGYSDTITANGFVMVVESAKDGSTTIDKTLPDGDGYTLELVKGTLRTLSYT